MITYRCSNVGKAFLLTGLLNLLILPFLFAQSSDKVNFEIEVGAALENADVLSLTSLGIDKSGAGPVLLSGVLENTTDQILENLYFEIKVSSAIYGVIVELDQRNTKPFSLDPHQSIYATNNDLANDRIPGIEEEITFTGGLTAAGEDFINDLEGSTTLPPDIYTVSITLYQVTNTFGRVDLTTATTEIGKSKTFEYSEIILKNPGDVVGEGVEISNVYPQFSWEGDNTQSYRLIVVKANDQDEPETLLQSAKDSPATNNGGSLLQYENLDVLVDGNSYQFPASGAQKLEEGQQYYWRVNLTLNTSGGTEEIYSEIWAFRITTTESDDAVKVPMSQEMTEAMNKLLGDTFRQLIDEGYAFEGIEIDGQKLTGPAAAQLLREIMRKIEDGEITLAND